MEYRKGLVKMEKNNVFMCRFIVLLNNPNNHVGQIEFAPISQRKESERQREGERLNQIMNLPKSCHRISVNKDLLPGPLNSQASTHLAHQGVLPCEKRKFLSPGVKDQGPQYIRAPYLSNHKLTIYIIIDVYISFLGRTCIPIILF